MKERTVTVREGEYCGPVDWTWFEKNSDAPRDDRLAMFRALVEGVGRGETWKATTDGGWPRVGWGEVLNVGMYDGWPYWAPTPSFYITGSYGGGWHSVHSLSEARRVEN